MTHHKNRLRESTPAGKLLRAALLGTSIAILTAIPSLLLATTLCYLSDDPLSCTFPAGLAVLYVSALVGGFAASRFNRDAPILSGTLCGVLWMLCTLLPLLLPGQEDFPIPPALAIALRLLTPAFSLLGSAFKRKTSHRRKPRRR